MPKLKRRQIKVELVTVPPTSYAIKITGNFDEYVLIPVSQLNDTIRALSIMRTNLEQLPLDFR